MAQHEKYFIPAYISAIPVEVVSHILSHLSITDRINTSIAVIPWQCSLHCPSTWRTVDIDMSSDTQKFLKTYMEAVSNYGKHFQNVVLSCTVAESGKFYLRTLQQISRNCVSLKSLKVFHPKTWKFSSFNDISEYGGWLRTIATNNKQLKKCSLCFANYSPVSPGLGFGEMIQELAIKHSAISHNVDKMEFSHEYPIVKKFLHLANLVNLNNLKCQIHNLNTDMLLMLLKRTKLVDLTVVNDAFTQRANWSEELQINWRHIKETLPQTNLNVHYHIKGRNWHADDFVINPYVTSLVVDCYPVSSFLEIVEMTSTYSETLQVVMLLASSEQQNPLSDFEDELCFVPAVYGALVHTCPLLHTFISTVSIPASAVLTIAANKKLRNIWIPEGAILYTTEDLPRSSLWSLDEDVKVDWWKKIVKDRESLVNIVSKFLGWAWVPQTAVNMQDKIDKFLAIM